jgi:hypothetical protein
MPNNLVVSGNLTINGTATYVNTQSISAKDPLFEVANDNNTTDAVDIGYYGRYYDAAQTRVEFTGLFRDASDAGKFKFFTGLTVEPTNVVDTTGTGYTVGTLVANVEGNLAGTANAANVLSTARTISATGDAAWSVSFDGSANATAALTLANTGVTATTYGTTTAVPTIAVDSKGRITSASNTNITFPVTTVNGFAGTVVLTTSDVAEGSNQYFTSARAQASITGGASSVVTADLTASRALVSDGSGKIAASASTTAAEIGFVAGVTSAIQTQLNGKLNLTGGTLTGGLSGTTGTFSGILTTPQVKAGTSAGLSINANSGTQVADFGAGGSANITFFGGLAGTSATFSGALSSNSLTLTNALSVANGGTGATSFTAQRIIYGNGTSALATSSNFYWETANNRLWIDRNDSGNISMILKNAFLNQGSLLQFQKNITTTGAINSYIGLGGDSTNNFIINHNGSDRLTIASNGSVQITANDSLLVLQAATVNKGIVIEYKNSAATRRGYVGYGGDSSSLFEISNNENGAIDFRTNAAFAMRIANGGNVGIGTSSPSEKLEVVRTTGAGCYIKIQDTGGSNFIGTESGNMVFLNGSASERMRITSGGYTKMSPNGTYLSSSSYHEMRQTAGDWTVGISNTNGNPRGIYQEYTAASPNGTANQFLYCADSTALRMEVRSNGGIANYATNNVVLSDVRLKKDITPLESVWNKIKNIEIVKYKFKDQTHDDFNMGVIAQQVEDVAPELIDIDGWGTSAEDGTTYKGIYESDINYYSIKALQEAMAKIETLEAEMAILKAK